MEGQSFGTLEKIEEYLVKQDLDVVKYFLEFIKVCLMELKIHNDRKVVVPLDPGNTILGMERLNVETLLKSYGFEHLDGDEWRYRLTGHSGIHRLQQLLVLLERSMIKINKMSDREEEEVEEEVEDISQGLLSSFLTCVVLRPGNEDGPKEEMIPSFIKNPKQLLNYCSNFTCFHDENKEVELYIDQINKEEEQGNGSRFTLCKLHQHPRNIENNNTKSVNLTFSQWYDSKHGLGRSQRVFGSVILLHIRREPFGLMSFTLDEFRQSRNQPRMEVEREGDFAPHFFGQPQPPQRGSNTISQNPFTFDVDHGSLYEDNDVEMLDKAPILEVSPSVNRNSVQRLWEDDLEKHEEEISALRKTQMEMEEQVFTLKETYAEARKDHLKAKEDFSRMKRHKLTALVKIRHNGENIGIEFIIPRSTLFKHFTQLLRFEMKKMAHSDHFCCKGPFAYERLSGDSVMTFDCRKNLEKSVCDLFNARTLCVLDVKPL